MQKDLSPPLSPFSFSAPIDSTKWPKFASLAPFPPLPFLNHAVCVLKPKHKSLYKNITYIPPPCFWSLFPPLNYSLHTLHPHPHPPHPPTDSQPQPLLRPALQRPLPLIIFAPSLFPFSFSRGGRGGGGVVLVCVAVGGGVGVAAVDGAVDKL
jgi:hypothetical protein